MRYIRMHSIQSRDSPDSFIRHRFSVRHRIALPVSQCCHRKCLCWYAIYSTKEDMDLIRRALKTIRGEFYCTYPALITDRVVLWAFISNDATRMKQNVSSSDELASLRRTYWSRPIRLSVCGHATTRERMIGFS